MTTPKTESPPAPHLATDSLAGRTILVTGAGQGLGRVAALAFAAHGATVVLHGRKLDKLEKVYDEIEGLGGATPAIVPLDFQKSTDDDYRQLADAIFVACKQLDGVFHGASHFSPLMSLGLQDGKAWAAHLTVNLSAPVAVTRAVLPMLRRAADASVVFLSEDHAIATAPRAYWGAFAAAKSALLPVVQMWQDEQPDDSRLSFKLAVPGPVSSPMRAQSHPGETGAQLPSPDTLAATFVYLMHPSSRALAGQAFHCQGTASAGAPTNAPA